MQRKTVVKKRECFQSTLCDLDVACFLDFLLDFFSDFSMVSPLLSVFLRVLCPDVTEVCLIPGYVA